LYSQFAERAPRGQFDAARLLWVWCVFVMIFFSFSDSKLIPYILPAIPALALLCASRQAGEAQGSLLTGALLSVASSLGILAYASGLWGSVAARPLLLAIRPMLFWTCTLLAIGALACAGCALRGRLRAALAALSIAWLLASGTILVAADAAQGLFSARDAALELRRQGGAADAQGLPTDVPIFAVQYYSQSLPFYLRRSVILVDYRDEFDLGLTLDPQRGIATLQQFTRVWLPLSDGFAIMSPSTLNRLYSLGLPMREIAHFPDCVIVSRR